MCSAHNLTIRYNNNKDQDKKKDQLPLCNKKTFSDTNEYVHTLEREYVSARSDNATSISPRSSIPFQNY